MRHFLIAICLIAVADASFAQQEPLRERGFKPEQVHQFNGFDSVNLFNGNLNLAIPIGHSYPVSAGLAYSFTLRYSGNVWKTVAHCPLSENPENPCGMRYLMQPTDNAGPGWRLAFGELRPANPNARPHTAPSMWQYTSPDASEHLFYSTLYDPVCTTAGATNCDTAVAGVGYTRDGTYLRLVDAPGSAKVVEFGNGQRQRFVVMDTPSGARWRLQYIYSVSSTLADGIPTTNYVKFEYPENTFDWKITDSHGREHRVYFQNGKVDKVEIAAFRRANDPEHVTSVYNFTYGAYTVNSAGQPIDGPSVNIAEPCDAVPQNGVQSMHFLTRLDLPSGDKYQFGYHQPTTSCSDKSAALLEATLPTGGALAWDYQTYGFVATPLDYASGVKERLVKDAGGTVIQKTTYEFVGQGAEGHDVVVRQCRAWTSTSCTPETKTVHHFITGQSTQFGYGPHFGLPVSPTLGDDDSFQLSTQTFSCGSSCSTTPERSMYLIHEFDFPSPISWNDCNLDYPCVRNVGRRVKSERTRYDKDGNRTADTFYSLFDGLGHYRKTETAGTFSSGNVRTTEANYNSHSRGGESVGVYATSPTAGRLAGYSSLRSTDPWILNTYGNAYTLENGLRSDVITCFDQSTGFLKRRRTLAGTTNAAQAKDLLAVFTRDAATGYVQSEEYFGGDRDQSLSLTDTCTLPLPAHNEYSFRMDHTYQYGSLESSAYMQANGTEMPFLSVNSTIDRNTGLVSANADPAGVVTSYRYDRAGRLDEIDQFGAAPLGLANTTYTYVSAIGGTAASVTVDTGTGASGTSVKYEFDSIGRIWREHHLMPDATWSVIQTQYDALGRRHFVSEKETYTGASFVPANKTEFSAYDAFGRVGLIRGPDSKETTITYTGDRLTTRTTDVATGLTSVTPAITVEERDRAGRLWQVTENGSDVTAYAYNQDNRLISVTMGTQPARLFNYDGRGFLTSERHPESGTTSYQYDARGHVVERDGEVATLTTAYDRAERVLSVTELGKGLLKEFVYDRANAGSDYSMGKLAEATRHNRSAALGDVQVKETYTYAKRYGLLSQKSTSITTVKNGVTTAGGTFSDSYDYDDLGSVKKVTYPTCTTDCAGQTGPLRSVTTSYAYGQVTGVGPYTSAITYHPNGLLYQIRHANVDDPDEGPLYTQTIANGMARPHEIEVANFCDGTNLRIEDQPESGDPVAPGSPAGLSVTAPGATQWQWYKVVGSTSQVVSGQATNELTSPVTADATYWVRVGNGSCTIDSNPATVYVAACPTVTLSVADSSSIPQGGNKAIHVAITGSAATSWTIQWSDESQTRTTSSASFDRLVTPTSTTQYTLTVLPSTGCAASVSNAVTVTVTPPPPTSVLATAVSVSRVDLSWGFTGQADQFKIERRGPGQASFVLIGTSALTTYADMTAVANTAYLYRVRAVKASTDSAPSNIDLATTLMFASDPLTALTEVSAQNILQLRTAANAVRALFGGQPFPFTDTSLSAVEAKAVHVLEIRSVLSDARDTLGLPVLQSTGPAPQVLQVITASEINDLRRGVQ